jgi:hypothetical protein
VASASSRPVAIQRVGSRCRCASSTQRVPLTHVLRDEGDGHHQPGDEAAAGLVVAAHEEVEGEQRWPPAAAAAPAPPAPSGSPAPCPAPSRVDQVGRRSGGTASCCGGSSITSRGGRKRRSSAYTVSADDAQHGDLAQRVEAAEVDQHHVDDVGAAALGQRASRGRRARSTAAPARQQRVRQRRQPPPMPPPRSAGRARRRHQARAAARCAGRPARRAWAASAGRAGTAPGGHHLHRQLRQRQVGRREPQRR